MTTVQDALNVLSDQHGFFPASWQEQARTVVEERGTDEEKALASRCMASQAPKQGEITTSINKTEGLFR